MFVEKLKNLNRSKKLFPFGIQTVRVLQNSIKDVHVHPTLKLYQKKISLLLSSGVQSPPLSAGCSLKFSTQLLVKECVKRIFPDADHRSVAKEVMMFILR